MDISLRLALAVQTARFSCDQRKNMLPKCPNELCRTLAVIDALANSLPGSVEERSKAKPRRGAYRSIRRLHVHRLTEVEEMVAHLVKPELDRRAFFWMAVRNFSNLGRKGVSGCANNVVLDQ